MTARPESPMPNDHPKARAVAEKLAERICASRTPCPTAGEQELDYLARCYLALLAERDGVVSEMRARVVDCRNPIVTDPVAMALAEMVGKWADRLEGKP